MCSEFKFQSAGFSGVEHLFNLVVSMLVWGGSGQGVVQVVRSNPVK